MIIKKDAPVDPLADDDAAYLYYRAEEQLELAQAATHPAAVRAHYQMADHYLDAAYGAGSDEDGKDGKDGKDGNGVRTTDTMPGNA